MTQFFTSNFSVFDYFIWVTMNTNIAENHDDYDDKFDDFLSGEDWD